MTSLWKTAVYCAAPRNPSRKGRLSTVDLLALTELDKLIFKLKILLPSFTKRAALKEELYCTELFPSVSVPCPL